MKRKFLITILLLSVFFTHSAQALFLFNPYVGKSYGEFEHGTDTGDIETSHYGMHLAFQDKRFTIGLDLSYMVNSFDRDFLSANQTYYKSYDYGVLIGFATDGMRLWGVLSLNSMEFEKNRNGFYFGEAYRFGIGFKVAGDVFLNIEKVRNIYTEKESGNGETTTIGTFIKTDSIMISISVPSYF
ncbi:MAG: hypothetical protein ACI9QD_000088 [Thermoproteota archaeon]|jgi:hypothetical protein